MDPDQSSSALARWRAAHQRAADAEAALLHGALLHAEGAGPAPEPAQWEEARQLRQAATELFRTAMEDVSRLNATAARVVADARPAPPQPLS
jgi:hypothetical protein